MSQQHGKCVPGMALHKQCYHTEIWDVEKICDLTHSVYSQQTNQPLCTPSIIKHLAWKPLTLCRAQRPKTSAQGRGQNVPKRSVVIGKLCCFQTRKFPYNLARISWIIRVRDFRYFILRHLHCLCVRSESKRAFESQVEEMRCRFSRRVSSMISDNDGWFYGFRAEDIVLREAVADLDFDANEASSVHSSDWSKWEQWWFRRRYCNRNGWSRRSRPINNQFTVRDRRKN